MTTRTHEMDTTDVDEDGVPTVRTSDAIAADVRALPETVTAWRWDLENARHRLLTALSGVDDDTDLSALRSQLIDEGLQKTEEGIVRAADATIARLEADLKTLEGTAWRHNLVGRDAAALPGVLPIVTEQASHMPGDTLLHAITSALVRNDRPELAAWTIVADRIGARRDITPTVRHQISGEIAKARQITGDRSMTILADDIHTRIRELRAVRQSVVDLVAETDEVRSGPLQVYRFGRKGIDGGYDTPRRPQPTAKWFRCRIGRTEATSCAHAHDASRPWKRLSILDHLAHRLSSLPPSTVP